MITKNIIKQKLGHKSSHLKDEEEYIVAATEIEGAHGLPRDTNTISNELQQVMHGVGRRESNKTIKSRSALRYACIVITRVYKEEENA